MLKLKIERMVQSAGHVDVNCCKRSHEYLSWCRYMDAETYENDLVQELETELKMEEFLKQRPDPEKAYMVNNVPVKCMKGAEVLAQESSQCSPASPCCRTAPPSGQKGKKTLWQSPALMKERDWKLFKLLFLVKVCILMATSSSSVHIIQQLSSKPVYTTERHSSPFPSRLIKPRISPWICICTHT